MHIGFWWKGNIKIDLREIGWGDMDWIAWFRMETSGWFL
jgi:hypothetical protein